jgi:miniconductance mechanosensitive channel
MIALLNPEYWMARIGDAVNATGVNEAVANTTTAAIGIVVLVFLAWLANFVAKEFLLRAIQSMVARTPWVWDDALLKAGVFTRLSHIAPALVLQVCGPAVFGGGDEARVFISAVVNVYSIIIALLVFSALINAIQHIVEQSARGAAVPVKGFAQAIKLVLFFVGGILVLSILVGKSPIYFLSGLGALTAVLLLVFRDALLGLVAGVMISVNQMVRVGDWIEMPKAGADGDVIDVSLTTVKVSNWDKTITTIPSYDLISCSFKNWRGMFDSGGRRIKRSIHIDMSTIRFIDSELLARFQRIRRLRSYLESKLDEINRENQANETDMEILCNGRRLTNVGTFRAYCVQYLREHPQIHQGMTFLVRQLAPTEHGLPLEIYVFTTDTRWAVYEGIQADIFDHLLAVLPEFGLRVFQQPSGSDVQRLAGGHGPASTAMVATSANTGAKV